MAGLLRELGGHGWAYKTMGGRGCHWSVPPSKLQVAEMELRLWNHIARDCIVHMFMVAGAEQSCYQRQLWHVSIGEVPYFYPFSDLRVLPCSNNTSSSAARLL